MPIVQAEPCTRRAIMNGIAAPSPTDIQLFDDGDVAIQDHGGGSMDITAAGSYRIIVRPFGTRLESLKVGEGPDDLLGYAWLSTDGLDLLIRLLSEVRDGIDAAPFTS